MRFRSPAALDRNGHGNARDLILGPLADNDTGDEQPKIGHPLSLADARAVASEATRNVSKRHRSSHRKEGGESTRQDRA
jgi:hypothetical protein